MGLGEETFSSASSTIWLPSWSGLCANLGFGVGLSFVFAVVVGVVVVGVVVVADSVVDDVADTVVDDVVDTVVDDVVDTVVDDVVDAFVVSEYAESGGSLPILLDLNLGIFQSLGMGGERTVEEERAGEGGGSETADDMLRTSEPSLSSDDDLARVRVE